MSTEQNKAVVRRFITEVLVGGNVDLVDDLLAPNYVNRGMGDMDRGSFKAWLSAASAGPGGRTEIQDLVAEGNAVVARFNYAITLPNGGEDHGSGPHLLPPLRWHDRGRRPHHHAGSDAGLCRSDAERALTDPSGLVGQWDSRQAGRFHVHKSEADTATPRQSCARRPAFGRSVVRNEYCSQGTALCALYAGRPTNQPTSTIA